MKKVISTEKRPIKLWLDDIEAGALEQAKNLANLPFVFKHIAIMPDSHLGYGMPIGGVMATKGVIVPNAVGVDIGCFDKDTEFLSPNGWKKISEWTGETVAQFNPNTNKATFISPIDYIKEKCNEFYHIKTKYGVDQMISSEHRCLVYRYDKKDEYNKYKVITAGALYKKHKELKLGIRDRFLTSFKIDKKTRINYSNNVIRIIVMLSADGHLDKNRFVLQFKKQRKIDRAKELLRNANIDFNETIYKNGITRISIKKVLINNFDGRNVILEKGLEKLWNADYNQLKIIVDEILYWDGNVKDKVFFTRKIEEANFVHYAISSTNKRGVLRSDKHKDGKLDYRVYQYENIKVGISGTPKTEIKKVKSKDGYKYSFTVPTSFLVTRRNGNVVVTGNCGMCAVKTSLTDIDADTLKKIMGEIRKVVPVGFNKHEEEQDDSYLKTPLLQWEDVDSILEHCRADDCGENYPIIYDNYSNALKSLGTLGGGNHFIEIQKGSDGHIWIMVHSGSRNLGFKVAEHYNKLAIELNKKWHSEIPKELELAFLPVDSDEGQAYIREMNYCIDFALASRKLMVDRIKDVFEKTSMKDTGKYSVCKYFDYHYEETVEKGLSKEDAWEVREKLMIGVANVHFEVMAEKETSVKFDEMINIAHNYASLENHFGENVWVHRKGATLATKDTIGIIPGSQGTKSYIVKGKGNPDSFNSCSHGAGRKLGRRQAIKTLDLEKEIKILDDAGVIHGMRNQKDLDESVSCYKNIEEVMNNQSDLVEILVELTPLGVIKG